MPASFLHEAFSDRSGVPLDFFELYYRGKRLEGEAALVSWGIGKGSTVEVKMRGRGGTGNNTGEQPQKPDEWPSSSSDPPTPSRDAVQKKLAEAEAVAAAEAVKVSAACSLMRPLGTFYAVLTLHSPLLSPLCRAPLARRRRMTGLPPLPPILRF